VFETDNKKKQMTLLWFILKKREDCGAHMFLTR